MDVNLIELHVGGHHRSYLEMLAAYWSVHVRGGVLRIFVTPEFVATHAEFAHNLGDRVEIHVLDLGAIPRGGISRAGKIRLDRLHRKALTHVDATHPGSTVLMYFDHAQLAVARFSGRPDSVSGLYFRSPFHEREGGRMSSGRGLRKSLVLRLALRNKGLHRVFCLDPRDVSAVDRLAGRPVAVALPDGVRIATPSHTRETQRRLLGAGETTRVLLMFGVICRRKGIVELSEAIDSMEPEYRDRMVVVVAGRKREEERKLVSETLHAISQRTRLVEIDGRVSDEAMASLFAATDVVLVAYTSQHVGSSGILIRAAASGRPVLGTSAGLMAKHIEDNRLGATVDPQSIDELAEALRRVVLDPSTGFDKGAARAFGLAHSGDRFSETFFAELGCVIS